ncbi:GNAT family N-acetyltransferase [Solimonas marina]|uniref:GNAT family N-acetyltransferase n=1 Tax=Solimonas marina TaxID=2714601 RepID=A0A969W8A2_9GAMM|nr:GNAT family N-acetyltransferase [Solimonas marina]NKF21734.1 GNAT family N-acetyltransferase [Solimonas marina]
MPTPAVIRRATAADAVSLWDLRSAAIDHGCRTHYAGELIDAWLATPMPASFGNRLEREPFLLAVDRDAIVGFAGLKLGTRELDALFVHPQHAGRGHGQHLLREAEQLARQLGLHELHLKASLNAVAFYEAAGYRIGEAGVHITGTGLRIGCRNMDKRLKADDAPPRDAT